MFGYTIIKTKTLDELYDLLEEYRDKCDGLSLDMRRLLDKHRHDKAEEARKASWARSDPGYGAVPSMMMGGDPILDPLTSVMIIQSIDSSSVNVYPSSVTVNSHGDSVGAVGAPYDSGIGSYSTGSSTGYDSTGYDSTGSSTGGDSTGTGGD